MGARTKQFASISASSGGWLREEAAEGSWCAGSRLSKGDLRGTGGSATRCMIEAAFDSSARDACDAEDKIEPVENRRSSSFEEDESRTYHDPECTRASLQPDLTKRRAGLRVAIAVTRPDERTAVIYTE